LSGFSGVRLLLFFGQVVPHLRQLLDEFRLLESRVFLSRESMGISNLEEGRRKEKANLFHGGALMRVEAKESSLGAFGTIVGLSLLASSLLLAFGLLFFDLGKRKKGDSKFEPTEQKKVRSSSFEKGVKTKMLDLLDRRNILLIKQGEGARIKAQNEWKRKRGSRR
jgi:hypothetical protein